LLPFDVTVEDLLSATHASRPRNKLVAQIFFDMGLIERYGGGIQRILDDCNASGLPAPVFENAQGGFRITFKALPESTN
jgi:ATP-dependent DNA helicase RecG